MECAIFHVQNLCSLPHKKFRLFCIFYKFRQAYPAGAWGASNKKEAVKKVSVIARQCAHCRGPARGFPPVTIPRIWVKPPIFGRNCSKIGGIATPVTSVTGSQWHLLYLSESLHLCYRRVPKGTVVWEVGQETSLLLDFMIEVRSNQFRISLFWVVGGLS